MARLHGVFSPHARPAAFSNTGDANTRHRIWKEVVRPLLRETFMRPRQITFVPHTHWDREWYEPFQTFRLKLVETVDALLDLMERDPAYARFLLDGQMAAVDDYLEVRPEAAGRIRALATAGRLTMGPWYALMDEFLVSGETIVRDLQLGLRRATVFGGAMTGTQLVAIGLVLAGGLIWWLRPGSKPAPAQTVSATR